MFQITENATNGKLPNQPTCCICKKPIPLNGTWAFGNNAEPVSSGRCCDDCNAWVVIPARLARPPDPAGAAKSISGKQLAYQLRHMSQDQRVRLALDLTAGRVGLHGLTIRQAAGLTNAPLAELNDIRRRRAGCSLRELQRRQRADRLVARIGGDRIMQALDRVTRPAVAAE